MTTNTNQPIEVLRDGSLKIAIFASPTENGVRYSGQLIRSYRDDAGNWKDTGYLSNAEFLRGGRLMSQAYDRIAVLKAAARHSGDDHAATEQ